MSYERDGLDLEVTGLAAWIVAACAVVLVGVATTVAVAAWALGRLEDAAWRWLSSRR